MLPPAHTASRIRVPIQHLAHREGLWAMPPGTDDQDLGNFRVHEVFTTAGVTRCHGSAIVAHWQGWCILGHNQLHVLHDGEHGHEMKPRCAARESKTPQGVCGSPCTALWRRRAMTYRLAASTRRRPCGRPRLGEPRPPWKCREAGGRRRSSSQVF